ncbi:lectin, partial [Trifolium medium]|nr:lectin [Trifolium medium]
DCAELIQVSWLEVSGKVGPADEGETYVVKFDIEVKDTGFGWGNTEVLVMAKIGKKGSYEYKPVKLACNYKGYIPKPNEEQLEITVKNQGSGEKDLDIHFGLYEVWSGKWKGGLKIKKAEVKKKKP